VAARIGNAEEQIGFTDTLREPDFSDKRRAGCKVSSDRQQIPAFCGENNPGGGELVRNGDSEPCNALDGLEVSRGAGAWGKRQRAAALQDANRNRSLQIRVLRRADLLNRIPILAPRLGFARLEEAEVRLVVGVNAGHDFDVRAVFTLGVRFGQVAIPGIAEFLIAPGPLFLAGGNVVVGNMDDACLGLMVVAADEIFL
jgi:hypothetical protein